MDAQTRLYDLAKGFDDLAKEHAAAGFKADAARFRRQALNARRQALAIYYADSVSSSVVGDYESGNVRTIKA